MTWCASTTMPWRAFSRLPTPPDPAARVGGHIPFGPRNQGGPGHLVRGDPFDGRLAGPASCVGCHGGNACCRPVHH
jgi:hypothetical protein